MPARRWILAGLLLQLSLRVLGVLTNVTVDDTDGDSLTGAQVSYSPADAWNVGQECVGCTAHPDPNQTYMGTWHDTTFIPATSATPTSNIVSLSVPFNGSALYVFCILTFTADHPAGNSDMQFWIDNDIVGFFELPANGSANYVYSFPVYVNESIEAGSHTFRLEAGHNNTKSIVIFDYLQYTYDDGTRASPDSSRTSRQGSHHSNSNGSNLSRKLIIIIAVVVSLLGVLLIAIAVVLFIYLRRRRRKKAADTARSPTNSTTPVFPREGPGDRWIARHPNAKPLPPLITDGWIHVSPPPSTRRVNREQQPSWLRSDPYPTAASAYSSPVTPTTGTAESYSSRFTSQPRTASRPLPTPVSAPPSPTDARSVYMPPVSPFLSLSGGGSLTRSNTRATLGTIASSIAPYSDPRSTHEDGVESESDFSTARHGAGPVSTITEHSEPASLVGSQPPSYHDSWARTEKPARGVWF
ncbi:hypothetical protein OE88DRAFT_1641182 [Heliocybe sulcata]|uniref:Uncharacterized protein n=1 Tax=Heliocybe sulcata TaxID=5364 RepID=A0A5C3NM74_9AGAM|nr:hypothetical protein OE88DRAFT_1641182 [Heliocybe sulcata]